MEFTNNTLIILFYGCFQISFRVGTLYTYMLHICTTIQYAVPDCHEYWCYNQQSLHSSIPLSDHWYSSMLQILCQAKTTEDCNMICNIAVDITQHQSDNKHGLLGYA